MPPPSPRRRSALTPRSFLACLRRARATLPIVALLVSVGYISSLRLSQPYFSRPYEHDELITVRHYTWAGVEADGEPRPLRRLHDLESLHRPGMREWVIGIFCSIGRWPEPNNHVVHSLFVGAATAIGGVTPWVVRLPALLGAIVFACAMYSLAVRTCRLESSAYLAGLLSFTFPYVVEYSQTARGYTWMLALQAMLLIGLLELRNRPRSIRLAAWCAACAVASFVNIVTMSLYWVVPAYTAMFLSTDGRNSLQETNREFLSPWQRCLVIQLLYIGSMGALFLIDRLPYVYSSTTQYGDVFRTAQEYYVLGSGVLQGVLPTPAWGIFGAVGLVGLLGFSRGRVRSAVAGVALIMVVVVIAHTIASQRVAYARVYGFALPPLILGAVWVAEAAIVFSKSQVKRWFASVTWLGASVVLINTGGVVQNIDSPFIQLCKQLSEMDDSSRDASTFATFGEGIPLTVELYYPDDWRRLSERLPQNEPVRLCFLVKRDGTREWGLNLRRRSTNVQWNPVDWPAREALNVENRYRGLELNGHSRRFEEQQATDRESLVFWYPDVDSVATSPQRVYDHLDRHGVRYLAVHDRYQIKLQVFDRLAAVMIVTNSAEEFEKAGQMLRSADNPAGQNAIAVTSDDWSGP